MRTWRDRLAWVLIPLVGAGWGAFQRRGTWFFFDEWSMIHRVITYDVGEGMTRPFNGHLWMLQDLVYRAQVNWFGVNSHAFVASVMVVALVLAHLSVASLLRAGGLPVVLSLLLAGLVTYLGAGAENMIFVVQSSPTLAVAASVAALAVVVSKSPTRGWSVTVGLALVAAAAFDSGLAIIGLALVTPAVIRCWPRRHLLVLAPAAALHAVWLVVADRGSDWPGTIARRLRFSVDLLFWGFGGLVGHPPLVGPFVAAPVLALVVFGYRRHMVSRRSTTLLWCGVVATVVAIGAIAQTRADLVGSDWFSSNRYVQVVSLLLVVGLAPALYDSWRGVVLTRTVTRSKRARTLLLHAAPIALVGLAFIGGLDKLGAYRRTVTTSHRTVHRTLDATAAIVRDGCPAGRSLDLAVEPNGRLNPAVDVALVRDLVDRGAYVVPDGVTPDPGLVDLVCPSD